MEEQLTHMKCEACEAGSSKVTDEEAVDYQKQIPEWVIIESDDVRRLERVFKFKNFVDALAFTNKVGAIAEEEGHHPAILTEWGRVGVAWWTHAIGGLHRNDFIMAAKTDQAFK
jgi:4a-hydroxytetrahydrobiopterin dehydratase